MTSDGYTLADLTRITGARRRSVQLWAEAGVIRAAPATERAGTGTHRRFSRDEAIIACIVSAFARRQMPIGQLLQISSLIRSGLDNPEDYPEIRYEIEKAVYDQGKVFFILKGSGTPGYVDSFGPHDEHVDHFQSVQVLDAGSAERDAMELVGHSVVKRLDAPGSFCAVIPLNAYLKDLR
jgi:hypothetical protein